MSDAIETIERNGFKIEIFIEEEADSPRTWDNVSIMQQLTRGFSGPDECDALVAAWEHYGGDTEKVEHYARAFLDAVAIDWWDDPRSESRVVAIIKREDAERECLGDPAATLKGELQTYAAWVLGEVYGYVITDPDGEVVDSCGGFYGDADREGYMLHQCAMVTVDLYLEERAERPAAEETAVSPDLSSMTSSPASAVRDEMVRALANTIACQAEAIATGPYDLKTRSATVGLMLHNCETLRAWVPVNQ